MTTLALPLAVDANHQAVSRVRSLAILLGMALVIACGFASPTFAQVVTYPAPAGMEMSGDYTVTVGGQRVAVYRGKGDGTSNRQPYSFAYFDYSGSALVQITSVTRSLSGVQVLPASKGIAASVSGNSMSFTMTREYCHLSIEPSGRHGSLLLFANPIETNAPAPGTAGVVYFGPGLHRPGAINLNSGQTLYIAGGAVVQGGVNARGSNVTIRGRGILDGYPWTGSNKPTATLIHGISCTNLNIDGIIVKDSWNWNIELDKCIGVTIKNLKLIANRTEWNDGIDICNSQQVMISDSFLRTDDDTIAPKGANWLAAPRPAVYDITVTRCSLWTDRAHVWRIGCESNAPAMDKMLFSDIDVLHYDPRGNNPFVSIEPADEMPITNIRFENIRINHEGQQPLIEVRPQACPPWSDTDRPGRISDVFFKDIVVTGNFNGIYGKVWVSGVDDNHAVRNVTFENLVRHGVLTQRTSPEVVIGVSAYNIQFTGPTTITPPSITTQPASRSVTAGQTATFSVVASGTAPLAYQWQKNNANISGATSTSYTTPATTIADSGATYRVFVSNSVASNIVSNNATLTVTASATAPVITTQPASRSVTVGQTATFSVVASGTAPLAYQWQKNNANISGATSASYTTPATTLADSGSAFRVLISNSFGSVTSASATLTVNAALPSGSGTGLTGQYFDNSNFTGANFSRTDATVNFAWGLGAPASSIGVDTFSVRWTGQVQPQYSQTYTFHVTGDDGVRLWVNGSLLIDKWINQSATEWSGSIALIAGNKYAIKLEYFENGVDAVAQLRWSSANTPKAIIPASRLFPGASIFKASADFSRTQGFRNWTYLDSNGTRLVYDSVTTTWKGTESYLWIWAHGCHPGPTRDIVRRWTAPQAGAISITGAVSDTDITGGAGIIAFIRKNGAGLWQTTIANGAPGVNFSLSQTVAAGDRIDFVVNRNGTYNYDTTTFDPTIILTTAAIPVGSG